jgi:hypothetical protein
MLEKFIYLGVMLGFFFVVKVLFNYFEERANYNKKMEHKRRNARFYETIDYTNFNPETGKYEDKN